MKDVYQVLASCECWPDIGTTIHVSTRDADSDFASSQSANGVMPHVSLHEACVKGEGMFIEATIYVGSPTDLLVILRHDY